MCPGVGRAMGWAHCSLTLTVPCQTNPNPRSPPRRSQGQQGHARRGAKETATALTHRNAATAARACCQPRPVRQGRTGTMGRATAQGQGDAMRPQPPGHRAVAQQGPPHPELARVGSGGLARPPFSKVSMPPSPPPYRHCPAPWHREPQPCPCHLTATPAAEMPPGPGLFLTPGVLSPAVQSGVPHTRPR